MNVSMDLEEIVKSTKERVIRGEEIPSLEELSFPKKTPSLKVIMGLLEDVVSVTEEISSAPPSLELNLRTIKGLLKEAKGNEKINKRVFFTYVLAVAILESILSKEIRGLDRYLKRLNEEVISIAEALSPE